MPDTPNMTEKVIENLNLLHNDLQEVKAVLVKNGITSTGASSKLASEVTKLPEKTEENIKKSTEVKGMVNGTLDITGGFTYSPSSSETLDTSNTIISSNTTEFTIPKGKKLGMFFPTDELANNLASTHTSYDDIHLKLTVHDMNLLDPNTMYLTTGWTNLVDYTVDIKDEFKKVNYNGVEYYDLTQETNTSNDWSDPNRKQFGGMVTFSDYKTKITLNGEVPEKIKCDTFVLSGNKFIKEVVCNMVMIDYRLLKHLFYKDAGLMNDFDDSATYDPIIVRLTNNYKEFSGYFYQENNYEYNTTDLEANFTKTADPLAVNSWTDLNLKPIYFKEQSKNFKGISANIAKLMSKLVHIYIDPSVINVDKLEAILLRLPLFNEDGSKKYNYSTKTWELVASATPDDKKYYEISPPLLYDGTVDTYKMLGKDKIPMLYNLYPYDTSSSSPLEGIVLINDRVFNKDRIISKYNTIWPACTNYSIGSGYKLHSTGLTPMSSQLRLLGKPVTVDVSRTTDAGVYPFGNEIMYTAFDFTIELGYIGKDETKLDYDMTYKPAFYVAPPFTKFKSNGEQITKMKFIDGEAPLIYNSTVSEVRVNKVVLPMHAKVFRDLVSGNIDNIYQTKPTPIKYIFEDTGVKVVKPSLEHYDEMADVDAFVKSAYNAPDYRFDYTQYEAIDKFAKYIHCCISETNPAMTDEDFLKYRIPLFNKDETKRYNYSTKQWVDADSYRIPFDATPSTELFPSKAEELSKMMVIGTPIY